MPDFVQITLHENGEGIEAVWARAVDAGLYEIASVPFLHMTPTAGDVVAASADASGGLTFDKVVKRGGRWVAVYNWFPEPGATTADVISRLDATAKKNDLVVESCLEPKPGIAGCVYVAAPHALTPEQLDSLVRNSGAPAALDRVLPVAGSPAKPARLARAAAKAKAPAKAKAKAPAKAKPKAKATTKARAKPKAKAKAKPKAKAKAKPKAKPAKRKKRR